MSARAPKLTPSGHLVPTTGYDRRIVGGIPQRVPVRGKAFVPDPLPPKEIDWDHFVGSLYEDIAAADRAMTRLDERAASLPNPDLFVMPFRRREAQLSSRIENTVATAEQIAMVEAGVNKDRGDAWEVWNYSRALDHGLESSLPLCIRLFNEMHAILLSDVRGDDKTPGAFRDVQAHIAGEDDRFESARFVPPPPGDHLVRCMHEFEQFLNPVATHRRVFPKIVEAALSHYQFECIHPYRDGNGRLGRLLVALSLCKDGFVNKPIIYVSSYLDRHKQEYFDLLLRVSTEGDWVSWVRFFCRAVATEATDGLARAKRLASLRESFIRKITRPKASGMLHKVIDHLFASPAIRIAPLAKFLNFSSPGTTNLVRHLVDAGILEEAVDLNYNRVYVCRQILAAIEDDLPPQSDTPA